MEDILFDFITLNIKCPLCNQSLMDEDVYIDGRAGIKLGIETKKEKGAIWLSSIYESYNYSCNIDTPKGEIVKLSCPHCLAGLESGNECHDCKAPMVYALLDIGGKVSICSRIGCKSHFLEFDDITSTLKKLFHLHEYEGSIPKGLVESGESKEIIESGTYLHTYCPHCKKSLIEKGLMKLKVVNPDKESGFVFLSPYLNVFTSRSTVFLPEDKVVDDILCAHCNTSLIDSEGICEECGSPSARILISARTKMIDFYVCSKKGCRWHGLDKNDLRDIDIEDSLEW